MTELLQLTINGRVQAAAIEGTDTLLDVLRRQWKLFSVREACGLGICGSCTVTLDGITVSSCLVLAAQANGRSVETVDALADEETGALHPIQRAFIEHNAFQCSYCTPGFLLATRELLAQEPAPTSEDVRHFLAGNICRCGSYFKIEEAVLDAAERLRAAEPRVPDAAPT